MDGRPVASGDLEVLALSKLFFLGLLDDRAERARVLDDLVSAIDRERASLEGFGEHLDAVDVPDGSRGSSTTSAVRSTTAS